MGTHYNKRCKYCGRYIKFSNVNGRWIPDKHFCPSEKNPHFKYILSQIVEPTTESASSTVMATTTATDTSMLATQITQPTPVHIGFFQRFKALFNKGASKSNNNDNNKQISIDKLNNIIEQRVMELQKTRASVKSKANDALLIREIQTMCIKELKDLQEKVKTLNS